MRLSNRALTAGLLLSLSFAGCKLVDLDKVAHYGCDADGVCPESTGGGAGGGTGTTGGGTGVTGGGGSSGLCGPLTCPNGCCNGDTCVTGNAQVACGRAGQQCTACGQGESCADGACTGCLATCTTGCCSGATCETRSAETCGVNQGVCMACGVGADHCTDQGTCACGDAEPCSSGQHCVSGVCQCDASSCPDGCCSPAGYCLKPSQQSAAQCGLGGDQCRACTRPEPPTCSDTSMGVRDTPTTPGACALGTCDYPVTEFVCQFGCDTATDNCVGDPCQGCLTPPQPVCLGATLRTWTNRGTCDPGAGCNYTYSDTSCTFGCADGECLTNPCTGVSCNTGAAPRCENGSSIATALPGTCNVTGSTHQCAYGEETTPCLFGCDDTTGLCRPDPCSGAQCTTAPAPTCASSTTRRVWVSPGACDSADAGCTFAIQDIACANGCVNGVCQGADPCEGVSCASPPTPICLDGFTRRTYGATGACNSQGFCDYTPNDTQCPFGCTEGTCRPDPCSNVSCETPPGDSCVSASTRRTYTASGTCTSGMCNYPFQDLSCSTAPAAQCVGPGGNTLRTYAPGGSCVNGACQYTTTDTVCTAGCSNGACNADPCDGVTCTTPPAATCANGSTRRVYGSTGYCQTDGGCAYQANDIACSTPPADTCTSATVLRHWSSSGTCASGTCSYTSMDSTCANGCSNGACNGDPCAGVSCTTPADVCANGSTRRHYTGPNTCSGGTCGAAPFNDIACNTPPANVCEGSSLRTYMPTGTCGGAGVCSYTSSLGSCPYGCANGQCNPDPCAGVSCNTAPADDCYNATTKRHYTTPGTCSGGTCGSYPSTTTACNTPPGATCNGNYRRTYSAAGTCSGAGVCSYSPIDTNCNTPPTTTSCSGSNLVTYVTQGTCSGAGVCAYTTQQTPCAFGCSNGQCNNDPCNGVSCVSPPAADCSDSTHQRVYNSSGTCSGGTCSYGYTTNTCPNGCSNGACLACNSSTCSYGCCTTQTTTGTCKDNETYCQGTGGGACGTACGGGRICDFGVCTCPVVNPNLPRKSAEADDVNAICGTCVHSIICP